MRTFESGATRDDDFDKIDYESYLSPLVIQRFGEYMLQHSTLPDGSKRSGDNWQHGFGLDVTLKSLWRHHVDVWSLHRSEQQHTIEMEEALCAVLFNAAAYLHQLLDDDAGVPVAGPLQLYKLQNNPEYRRLIEEEAEIIRHGQRFVRPETSEDVRSEGTVKMRDPYVIRVDDDGEVLAGSSDNMARFGPFPSMPIGTADVTSGPSPSGQLESPGDRDYEAYAAWEATQPDVYMDRCAGEHVRALEQALEAAANRELDLEGRLLMSLRKHGEQLTAQNNRLQALEDVARRQGMLQHRGDGKPFPSMQGFGVGKVLGPRPWSWI